MLRALGSPSSSSALPARRLCNGLQAPVKALQRAFTRPALSAKIAAPRLFASLASQASH